jgi:ABC-type bacteriocin/lantibiotic exporter with double-glycine peptidase domain
VAQSFGLEVVYRNKPTINDLKEYLQLGYTAILNIQAWGQYDEHTDFEGIWEDGHYAVLVNIINDDIILMDRSIAGRYGRLSRSKFEAHWHDWSDNGLTK